MAGAANTDGGDRGLYLVGIGVFLADGAGKGTHAALEEIVDGLLAAIGSTGVVVVLDLETAVGLDRYEGAINELDLHPAFGGLEQVAGIDLVPGLQLAHAPRRISGRWLAGNKYRVAGEIGSDCRQGAEQGKQAAAKESGQVICVHC